MNTNEANKQKVAVFGSAFNPPSLGHKSVIESLTHFDRVLLLPSIAHAWGKEMLEYGDRCAMVDLFIRDLVLSDRSGVKLERSVIEEKLHKPGESVTTFSVLEALQQKYPEADITFVIGPDNFFSFSKFYKSDEIMRRWSVMACPEKVKVRSTDIRNLIKAGGDISALTTESVREYMLNNGLYS